MANMTRAQMVTELQSRGWSRFAPADLQRYLDWALQDLYGKAKFDRSLLTVGFSNDTVLDSFTFTTIAGGEESINEVSAVYVQQSGQDPVKLAPATEAEFLEVIWPNTMSPNPDRGVPTMYYVYDLKVLLYPKPSEAVDIHFHHKQREDVFSGDGDVSGLPERFDKAIIALAEIHCNRRSHNFEDMAAAQAVFQEFLLEEVGASESTMGEETRRVQAWRA